MPGRTKAPFIPLREFVSTGTGSGKGCPGTGRAPGAPGAPDAPDAPGKLGGR